MSTVLVIFWVIVALVLLVAGGLAIADAAGRQLRYRRRCTRAVWDRSCARGFRTRGGALLMTRPWTYRAACRDLVEAGGGSGAYAARHGEIQVPVGVLFGDGDRILDPRVHGEGLRRQLPDVDLQLLQGGGPLIPLVRVDETVTFIERMAAKAAPEARVR